MSQSNESAQSDVCAQAVHPAAPRGLLVLLTAAAFLIFAQAFMIAPTLPRLAQVFHTNTGIVGLAVPAYLVPYGVMTLVWGPLSDRVGRRPVIIGSLVAFTALTAATALTDSAGGFIAMRVATAIGASGVVPISLALIGDVYPFHRRGRALGWLFGGMAGGMVLLFAAVGTRALPITPRPANVPPLRAVAAGYRGLLGSSRGRRTYSYVLINAVLQSGVYTWLGLYLQRRFGLGELGIGLTLLGYGIPGLLLGPVIGHLVDRYGRDRIIPAGVALGATCALWPCPCPASPCRPPSSPSPWAMT